LRVRRFFIEQFEISGDKVIFSPDKLHYLKNVLHLKSGDRVTAFDGIRRYNLVLEQDKNCELIGNITNLYEETAVVPLTIDLAFGCVRPGPTEEIIRHCTEIGVRSFFPLLLEHSNRRPAKTRPRWLKIAASACAQSGRTIMPEINEPMGLEQFLGKVKADSCTICLANNREASSLGVVLDIYAPKNVTLLVGPEGGLAKHEESFLAVSRFCFASLGPAVLRTETATIVAAGIVMNWGLIHTCR